MSDPTDIVELREVTAADVEMTPNAVVALGINARDAEIVQLQERVVDLEQDCDGYQREIVRLRDENRRLKLVMRKHLSTSGDG